MKRNALSLFFLFLFTELLILGQTDVSVSRKDFKAGKQGFSEAWDHVRKGDELFSKGGIFYGKAYDEYIQALVYNNSNAALNYKTGVSALFSDRKEESGAFLEKALGLKSDVTDDILLMTGRALQYEGRFTDAIDMLSRFITADVRKSKADTALARKCILECNFALLETDTINYKITNLGAEINSVYDDYSGILSNGGSTIYFATRRDPDGDERNSTRQDENIFTSSLSFGAWGTAVSAGKELTTDFSETPVFINSTNDTLYIYAGNEGEGDIMMSVKKKELWRSPVTLPFPVNGIGAQTSFCVSPSGNEICFVSEGGKDNKGGKDIYIIRKLNKRRWTRPVNALKLNTSFDEESVKLSVSGDTLWFSSKGHNTVGGFDIFYSVRNEAGEWDSVKNAGYPINTPWNELFFTPSPGNRSLYYFASDRKGGYGRLDIWSAEVSHREITVIPDTSAFSLPPVLSPVDTIPVLSPADTIKINDAGLIREVPGVELPIVNDPAALKPD